MDMSALLDMFAVDIRVSPATNEDIGGWVDSEWKTAPKPEPFVVHEPFLPNSRVGMENIVALIRDTGQAQKYAAVWLSKGEYPIKTIVEHKGKQYSVEQIKDLTDYSNVTIYYLESEDNQQDQPEEVGVGAADQKL